MTDRERDRFSLVGHAQLPFLDPLEPHELERLLDAAGLTAGVRMVDVGGGRADLACLAARRYGARAISVDRSAPACEAARERVAARRGSFASGGDVEVVEGDAGAYVASVARSAAEGERPFALGSVLGAVHAFGVGRAGWARTIDALASIADVVLVGDLAARTDEAAAAFEVVRLDEALAPAQLVAHGLSVRASCVLEDDRVARYERAYCDALAAYVLAHPADPRAAWVRARIAWADEPSLRTARRALVFAAYVLTRGASGRA